MSDPARRIADNLAAVRGRMAEAARRAGRAAEAVRLVGVTKYVGVGETEALISAGCRTLGESRPQQLWDKAEAVAGAEWHMIGHLQRNKVRRTLPLVAMIESIDNPRLLEALDRIAGELGLRVPVLLEVNTSGEAAKHGFAPDDVEPCLATLPDHPHIEVRGLMCMAALAGGLDEARRDFAALGQLRDRLATRCPDGVRLDELSMGMSGDFEVAIEEGATIVRVGSLLFEGVM